MSIGMSYEDFWHGDVSMAKAYRCAKELQDKRKNQELWLQGRYIYDAICAAAPLLRFTFSKSPVKASPYLEEPYPVTAAEASEKEERTAKMKQERLKAEFAAYVERLKKKMPSEAHPQQKGVKTNDHH